MPICDEHPATIYRLPLDLKKSDWSSGLPIANGILGAMVWLKQNELILSLDRTDVWDTRPVPEFNTKSYSLDRLIELARADKMEVVEAEFEAPYKRPEPTKLPVGRLRLKAADVIVEGGQLALDRAIVDIDTSKGRLQSAALASTDCIAIWTDDTALIEQFVLEAPAFGDTPPPGEVSFLSLISAGHPQDLDYEKPQHFEADTISGFVQTIYGGAFAAGILRHIENDMAVAYVHVATGSCAEEAKTKLVAVLSKMAKRALDDHLSEHLEWWEKKWSVSWLSLPDAPDREKWWAVDTYYMIAAAQSGAPPVALQGPWTTDAGYLPPWKGDYHHDLNTQMTYQPLYTAGRFEASRVMIDWLWETADVCRDWTKRFFGKPGLCVPMTADINNRQLGGWAPYTHSLTSAAWLAHNIWLDWRYGRDRTLLEEKIAPWICEVAEFLDAVMALDEETGRRKPPVSTSPEWNDNRREAFFWDWTNYDLALTRFAFMAAADVCNELGQAKRVAYWQRCLSECPKLLVAEDQSLLIAEGEVWNQPHRHFSNGLAIMPLHQLDPLDVDDRNIINATLKRYEEHGTGLWMGYTFSWWACMNGRIGDADKVLEALRIFDDGFRYPNGLHTNGDISGKGYMNLPFDCFTLEGNCLAATAVQDMFVQSRPGRIDLLMAWPDCWKSAYVRGFRADGGIEIVYMDIENGKVRLELRASDVTAIDVTLRGQHVDRVNFTAHEIVSLTYSL